MTDEKLLNKFDRIQDLPVSEEILGAYLEGNLSPSEIFDVESAIQEYDYLCDLVDSNTEYDTGIDNISIDSNLGDLELPIIPDDSYIELDLAYSSFPETEDFDYIATCAIDDQYLHDDSYDDDSIDNPFEDDDTSFDSSDDNDISDYE